MSEIKKRDDDTLSKRGLDISKLKRTGDSSRSVEEVVRSIKKSPVGGFPSLQVLMMFDITGSMFPHFDLVRRKLREIVKAVKEESRNSEFSVFAYRNHGDTEYDQTYYTSPLTSNLEEIMGRISTIRKGGGKPDWLTCMEDCFWEANRLSWNFSSPKAVVVIGDMPPHGVVDSKLNCPNEIDYEAEVMSLKSKGIKIYPVFCPSSSHRETESKKFYQWLADETDGKYLEISEISLLVELLIGICMKETGNLDKYIEGLRQRKQLTSQKERALLMLK